MFYIFLHCVLSILYEYLWSIENNTTDIIEDRFEENKLTDVAEDNINGAIEIIMIEQGKEDDFNGNEEGFESNQKVMNMSEMPNFMEVQKVNSKKKQRIKISDTLSFSIGSMALLSIIFTPIYTCKSNENDSYFTQLIAIQLLSIFLHFVQLSLPFFPLCIHFKLLMGDNTFIETVVCGGWFLEKKKKTRGWNESEQKPSFFRYFLIEIPLFKFFTNTTTSEKSVVLKIPETKIREGFPVFESNNVTISLKDDEYETGTENDYYAV